jgi:hypothetical protein
MRISKPGFAAGLAAVAILCTSPTFAQDTDPPAIAARIAWLSGSVSLEAQGAQDWSVAPLNYPMVSGDRIYTGDGARAVVQSGSTDVRLWADSDVTLTNLNEQYEQIGIAQGSVRVRVYNIDPGNTIELDTPSGAVIIQNPGDYRVNVYPDQQASVVEVNAGTVQIAGPGVNQEVDQGESVQLFGTNPVEVGAVDMAPLDGLDSWSADRDRHILNSASARYVSRYVPGYDDLDDYGGWTPTPDYGPVWFPNSMAAGWQPYTTGHWAYVAPWGYTWVDDAPWGYAPFHYGRWVVWNGRWGWVPGPPTVRPVYAPAFVAFVGGGPGFSLGVGFSGGGAAAWFPLGVAEPFVPWYRCSPQYVRTVNVTNVNITVIHNVTIVNNYNVFINHVTTVRSVNEIQVNNITYANRARLVAVPASAMSSGARVQQAAIHLNSQQQQQLAHASVAAGRPPAAAPPHPMAGVRATVSRPAARPVLMTPHGRAAATPTSNAPHFAPASLPKPAPATAIKPATRTVAPNVRPAAPGSNAGRPGTPSPASRPATPPASTPAPPASRSVQPPASRPAPTPVRPNPPPVNSRPAPSETRPAPAAPTRPNNNVPAPQSRPLTPESRPAPPPSRPAPQEHPAPQTTRPETQPARPTPQERLAPQPARPETQPVRPTPQERPAPQNVRPAPQARPAQPPAKNPPPKNPPPKGQEKKPPKDEHPPQG